jgi:hypothetical protein
MELRNFLSLKTPPLCALRRTNDAERVANLAEGDVVFGIVNDDGHEILYLFATYGLSKQKP